MVNCQLIIFFNFAVGLKLLDMRKLCFVLMSLFLLVGSFNESYAQFNRKAIKKNNKSMASFQGKKRGFSRQNVYSGVGFSLNALNYFGDLAPTPSAFSTDISFTKPGFGISLFHRFGPRYTLQVQYMFGTLKGSDKESANENDLSNGFFRAQRNASFRNRIHELSAVAYFDLFDNQSTYISRVKWTPYFFVGAALFYHNPQAQAPATFLDGTTNPYAGQWVDLQPLGTEGQYATLAPSDANYEIKPYSNLQFAIPFGIGARFRLNEVFDLWADLGFRYTFTDYLDDVSQNYVDLGKIKAENGDPTLTKLAQALSYRTNELYTPQQIAADPFNFGSYVGADGNTYLTRSGFGREFPTNNRGNKNNNDIYMVTSVRLTYILGATFHKAKFR
jgi:hypothetical protein